MRAFKLVSPHMTGDDVREFQGDLNERYAKWEIGKAIGVDGDYGPQTRDATTEVCTALGIEAAAMEHGVTPELRIVIRHPERRTPEQKARAASEPARRLRAKLRKQFAPGPAVLLQGIDVSNLQQNVDFHAVKASGRTFAFHKVSEGLHAPDSRFKARWSAMRDAGLVRGAYHFGRPQVGRHPQDEVKEFLDLVDAAGGLHDDDLRPVLDIEAYGKAGRLSPQRTVDWVKGFVDAVHARKGVTPIIYTGAFWRDQMGNPASNFDCPLWLAAFVNDPDPFVPVAWKQDGGYTIHQFSGSGSCAGVSGDCDLDRVPGGKAALDDLRMAA